MYSAYIARNSAGEIKCFSLPPGAQKPIARRGKTLQYLAGPSRGETKEAAKKAVMELKGQALMLARRWAISSPIGHTEKPREFVLVPSLGNPGSPPAEMPVDISAEIDF